MVYSDVIKADWILPYKVKYTMKDVNKVLNSPLFFSPNMGEAIFIVKCSAFFHNTNFTTSLDKSLSRFRSKLSLEK